MDWKVLVFGKKPETIKEYKRSMSNHRLMMWIYVFVTVIIFFGSLQQANEIDRCWDELETFRNSESVIAGIPVSNCYLEDGQLICNDDFNLLT